MNFLRKFKTLIIVVVVIVIAFIAYTKFVPSSASTASGVVRTTAGSNVASDRAGTDGPAREFVNQLLAIQNIHFNVSIFNDQTYLSLQDFSRELIPQPAGRPNPFAPLGQSDAEVAADSASPAASTTGFTLSSDKSAATSTRPRTTRR